MSPTIKRVIATTAAAVAAIASTVLVTPGSAQAAPYNRGCGHGYMMVDQIDLAMGTVYLAHNRFTDRHCVITLRNHPGRPVLMGAFIKWSGDPGWVRDVGFRTFQAGPVTLHTRHRCIDWGGQIGFEKRFRFRDRCH